MTDAIRPGSAEEIVQLGLDQAAQAVLAAGDARLAEAEALRALVTSPAVRALLEERIAQVVARGHSAELDDLLPIGWLPMEARQRLERVRDALVAKPRDLGAVRRLLVESGALCLAALDRLDRAVAGGEESVSASRLSPGQAARR